MLLLHSKCKRNWAEAHASYCFWEKRERGLREKYKEHKGNFESVYLHDDRVNLTQIWNGRCPTLRSKNGEFLFRHY